MQPVQFYVQENVQNKLCMNFNYRQNKEYDIQSY